MEEKNNSIENKETDFMNGFKYEAKSTAFAFVGNLFSGFSNFLGFGASSESAVKDSDSSLKEQLAKFLSDQKVSIDIKSVRWVFKKLIEQNCVIGEETLKYLCDLCKKENQDKNSVENQENKENNEKGNQNENGVENQLISTLLKTEYVYTDEEDKKQKIRKCVLTDSLFKKVVDLIDQKDFDTKENVGCVFQLIGNIIGGFLSQKNKVSYSDILGLVEKFGIDATVKILIDFFDKCDSDAVKVKIESLVVDSSVHDKFGKTFPGMLAGYQATFKNIQNNIPSSIALESFVDYITAFHNDLTCNNQIKNDKNKLNLHRQFIFSILEKTLLKMPEKASDEEKKLMALWSKKIKNVIVGGEENNNLEGKNNRDEEKNIIKEENNANKINVIKENENDNYDFISTILTKVSSVISELSVNNLLIDKNQNPSVKVNDTKNENITTNFLKAIWKKLEDKEKNHLKVLVLPIVSKMFGKETWKKNILMYGLKIFGLENFDQIDNKNLDSIFNSVMNIIDNLPNEKDDDESKKNKISQISTNLKIIIDALFQVNKNLEQIKDSVDSLIDILFSLPKDFKDKDGKINFSQIKKILGDISRDETKLNAVNSMMKLFCTDENFLTNLIDGILGKNSWKANVLKHGLKLFGVRFDNLKNGDLKSVLDSVTKIIDNLSNEKDTDERKKQKISAIIEETKIIFKILLVGKNENKNFDDLAQNLIDILLSDDLSQVEIIDKVEKILATVEDNFVCNDNFDVFKNFVKAFLNNGDFLLDTVNDVETLRSVIKDGKTELEGLTDDDKEKNWFVPVLDNLCKLLINSIDRSKDFVAHIKEILRVYKNFAKSIDIPASAQCCKDAFVDLEDDEYVLFQFDGSTIFQKICAVNSVKEKYDALKKFCNQKNKLVHDKDEKKDDFRQIEELYNKFMKAVNESNIIFTPEEQKKFNNFRFTFEINQTEAVNSVQGMLKIINEILRAIPENKQQGSLAYVKELLKSVFKDGRILKFITASDELKAIHPILSNAFEQLARLVEIKINNINDLEQFNGFITDDISGLLNIYIKFAEALDADSKNNPNYQTDIINSIQEMIKHMKKNFLIDNSPKSKEAYQNLLKAFFSSIKNEDKLNLLDSIKNIVVPNGNDPDETNILTFVIDKIDDKSMSKTSKAALKKSLSCLMPLVQNSVEKKNFEKNLFSLFNSYKTLAKELDKSFNFQAAKSFVGNQDVKNKYAGNEELKRAFHDLSKEINMLVPDTKKIMHKYKLFRNKIQKITNTGNKDFELTQEQKNIFEEFELDQNKAVLAIKNILMSISEFCYSDEEIQNGNNIINEDDINKKNNILVNSNLINTDINNKDNESNNGNEKPFNKVLINLLQGGNFLKDIINGIDSDNDADMRDDLKKYLANLSGPLCKFLISYLEKTNDTPSEIANKFNEIMSKYLEVMKVINDAEIEINELLQQVENLLWYLENNIVNGNQAVFGNYKNLYSAVVSGGTIFNLLAAEVQNNLDDNTKGKYRKYFQLVDKKNVLIFGHIFNKISDNVKDKKFFSDLISKFRNAYSIFSQSKSLSKSIKNLFGVRKRSNNNQNTDIDNENHVFKIIMERLEWERPSNNTMINDKNTIIQRNTNSNLINKNTDNNILNNSYENIISNATKNEIERSKDGKESLDNQDDKIYLSEFLFASSWKITRWLAELLLINQKTFDALKTYINQAKNDDEIIDTLDRIINLNDLLNMYVTFWRVTNLLFWRESKWYYPVVVGEIILSLTIFSPFVIPSSLYSLAKYFWTWMFKKNDKPPIPPGRLPRQSENPQDQNIVISTDMKQNNEKDKTDGILVVNTVEKKRDNSITIESNNANGQISVD